MKKAVNPPSREGRSPPLRKACNVRCFGGVPLRALIRDVPGFPKPGIIFKDITPLLLQPDALRHAAKMILNEFSGEKIDVVAGIESRGFVVGTAVALELGAGLALVRKKGKLPWKKLAESYQLEYGTDTVEIHSDAVKPGQKVLVIDDLLATGGTAAATCRLVENLKGELVGCGFIIELSSLNGRRKLSDYRVVSLIQYDSE